MSTTAAGRFIHKLAQLKTTSSAVFLFDSLDKNSLFNASIPQHVHFGIFFIQVLHHFRYFA